MAAFSLPFETKLETPEMRLIVACCRQSLGQNVPEEMQSLLRAGINEELFFELCEENRLLLLIYRDLVIPNRAAFSAKIRTQFERSAEKKTFGHFNLARWVVHTHQLFQEHHVPHVYLKGPVLNDVLFSGRVVRSSHDVDIVVPPDHVLLADLLLRVAGFTADHSPRAIRKLLRWSRLGRKDIIYSKAGFPQTIELHWNVDQVDSSLSRDGMGWDNLKHLEFHGEQIPVLEEIPNLLHLCSQAATHNWSRLSWAFEIAVALRSVAVDELLGWAKLCQLEAVVLEALLLRRQVFEVDWAGREAIPAEKWASVEAALALRFNQNVDDNQTPPASGVGASLRERLISGSVRDRWASWAVSSGVSLRRRFREMRQTLLSQS